MTILFCFFLSGATALIYEVIWAKYLTLLFGSTIQAQTVVLAVFMSGLALGNRIFGRFADRTRYPLAIYGCLEVGVGLYGFSFSAIYALATWIFVAIGTPLLAYRHWLLLLKGVLSVALLIAPTIMMGGTLPMLAAWLHRETADASRRSARFYSINSLGAVCGAGLAGFILVQRLGMRTTGQLTALVNVLIGIGVILIARRQAPLSSNMTPGAETSGNLPGAPAISSRVFSWGCLLVGVTGAVSMGLEVLASRCLCLVFGASLQVFAIVLMSFILGIGFGSAVIASPRWRHWRKETATVILLLAAAILIGLLVFNIENLVQGYADAQGGLSRTAVGYWYHQLMLSAISLFVLGLPAAALGAVLPLWMRLAPSESDPLGDLVGRLLTWNTLGAMGGALLTGFALMPGIGLRSSFLVLSAVLVLAALLVALLTTQRRLIAPTVVVAGFVVWVTVDGGEGWRQILSSGVFREPVTNLSATMIERRKSVKLLFYEDAADATVSVEAQQTPYGSRELALRINGKVDATSRADLPTQLLLGQLPLMARPGAREVFCFGLGSGITAATTLGYPIEHLTVAENCGPVLRAAKLFAAWNRGVLTNDRVRLFREDARTVLRLCPQEYDVIIAEPSNPWMVGIGSVFSREFYETAARRLKPGGIMAQWFHTYEVDDALLKLVLRTFTSVFPNVEIWDAREGDIVLLGSKRPWPSNPGVFRSAFVLAQPRRDLARIGMTSPEAVLARQLASQDTAFAVPGPGRLQSDDLPILEYEAPRTFYIDLGRTAEYLQRVDERTWQADIAPLEKNRALRELTSTQLKDIFDKYGSMNQELQSYVRMRFEGRVSQQQYSLLAIPCTFSGTNGSIVFAPEGVKTNEMLVQLLNAEVAFRTGSTNQAAAVELVGHILDALRDYNSRSSGWSPSHYAALAVKASLRLGKAAEARAILLRGLALEPGSGELRYLSRILVRRGLLQSGDVPPPPKRVTQPDGPLPAG